MMSEHKTLMCHKETSTEQLYPMRLQKFLARAGVASRRGSENLMTAGRVRVNDQVVTELGSKVDPIRDVVEVDGKRVEWGSAAITLVLNKPAGCVTTMHDPQGRPTVKSYVPTLDYPGLFPVGRLDYDTSGLLLFTTNGELGHALMHPSHHVDKTYLACVEGHLSTRDIKKLERGLDLGDFVTSPAQAEILTASQVLAFCSVDPRFSSVNFEHQSVIRLTIHEGKKHQVKRMFKYLGHEVCYLHRTQVGPIVLGDVLPGAWRPLTHGETKQLQAGLLNRK